MNLAPQPTSLTLDQYLVIRSSFCRSVNLTRDSDSLELIHSYVPTSRALDALGQIASQLHAGAQFFWVSKSPGVLLLKALSRACGFATNS